MKSLTRTALLVLFLLIAGLTVNAHAREDKTGNFNFNETTGLINMPTARTVDYRDIKLSVRMAKMGKKAPLKNKNQTNTPGPNSGSIFDSDWWIDNNGDRELVISPIRNIELSFMNIHSYTVSPVIGGKWVCVKESEKFPAIAIGIQNATAVKEDSNVHSQEVIDANSKVAPFIVASKSFFKDKWLDLSAGYGDGRFRKRIFYGGQAYMDKKKIWSLVGEFDGNIYSYGMKIKPYKSRWDFGAFVQNVENVGVTINYTIKY
ncbi:MAG: hypothetical protein LWY06_19615 [Firmicutes bacterium]|nr:hypothetical protein [Bacillota bacterium]